MQMTNCSFSCMAQCAVQSKIPTQPSFSSKLPKSMSVILSLVQSIVYLLLWLFNTLIPVDQQRLRVKGTLNIQQETNQVICCMHKPLIQKPPPNYSIKAFGHFNVSTSCFNIRMYLFWQKAIQPQIWGIKSAFDSTQANWLVLLHTRKDREMSSRCVSVCCGMSMLSSKLKHRMAPTQHCDQKVHPLPNTAKFFVLPLIWQPSLLFPRS